MNQIPFSRVRDTPYPFHLNQDDIKFEGDLSNFRQDQLLLVAKITGSLPVQCFRCGESFDLKVNEDVSFLLHNGIYHGQDETYDVVEVENGMVDLSEVFQSETTLIQCDYHACPACIENERKDYGST